MKIEKGKLIPLNLQFFAEDNNDEGNNGSQNDNQNEGGNNEGNQDQNSGEKMFSQSQVNAMMTKEKKEGKKSVLNALGFNSEDEAKNAFNLLKALTDSQKSAEELAKESQKESDKKLKEANDKALKAENKLSCLMAGVDKDSIDDVLAIALNKTTDDKNLDSVLEDMKKEDRYKTFFNSSSNSSGTGNPPGHSGGSNALGDDYGKILANRNSDNNSGSKNNFSYFN